MKRTPPPFSGRFLYGLGGCVVVAVIAIAASVLYAPGFRGVAPLSTGAGLLVLLALVPVVAFGCLVMVVAHVVRLLHRIEENTRLIALQLDGDLNETLGQGGVPRGWVEKMERERRVRRGPEIVEPKL